MMEENRNSSSSNEALKPSFLNQNSAAQQENNSKTDPIAQVTNLDREEVMEEALSRTTQYTPFEAPKTDFNPRTQNSDNKKAIIFIAIVFVIMFLFILFLPQISKMFGW